MRIKITEKNKEKIESLISASQAGCKTRLVSYDIIVYKIECIADFFEFHSIPLKVRAGKKVTVDYYAQTFSRSYKYPAVSTVFEVEIGANGRDFFLTDIHRGSTGNRQYRLEKYPDVSQAIINNAYEEFNPIKP